MPGWLSELAKLLGFSTPLIYAVAVYGAFHWLDKKASGPAKNAMTAWLQSEQGRTDTTSIAIELFDKLYSRPLLSFRAFVRSAIITLGLCMIIWFEMGVIRSLVAIDQSIFRFAIIFTSLTVIFNIVSDYASLFVVRRMLIMSRSRPISPLLVGPIAGIVIVYSFFILRMLAWRGIQLKYFCCEILLLPSWTMQPHWYLFKWVSPPDWSVFPAIAVHLWLPLFGLATLGAQLLVWAALAARGMQWFVKQGKNHPFEAVGCVAAAIIFVATAGYQLLRAQVG